jgi:phage terminase Nu1 subunit (DNA packaging protein)
MTQISTHELAALLGLSERSVRDLARRQILIREGRGFDRDASVKSYCGHLHAAATGKRGPGSVSAATEERTRLARLQGDALELKNKLASGELVYEADVESSTEELVIKTRTAVLQQPDRILAELPHLTRHDQAGVV